MSPAPKPKLPPKSPVSIASFGMLLHSSWETMRGHAQVFLIGMLMVSIAYAASAGIVSRSIQGTVADSLQGFGMDPARFEELSRRMQEGDETAYDEMMNDVGALATQMEGMDETAKEEFVRKQMTSAFRGLLPQLITLVIFSLLLISFASVYYLVVAVESRDDAIDVARRALGLLFPMILVWAWMMIRSFGWIGVLGIVPPLAPLFPALVLAGIACACILGPRLTLAPILYLTKGSGIAGSVSESYRLSRGYWWKIVSNSFLILFAVVLFQSVAMIPVSMLGGSTSIVAMFASIFIQQCALAFMTIFMAKLSQSIIANPAVAKS